MLNRIFIMGRIVNDLELRKTTAGTSVLKFRIACPRKVKSQNGDGKTDFINCIAWRGTAELISKYSGKGELIVIEGRLEIDTWKSKDGEPRKSEQIVVSSVNFCGRRIEEASPYNARNDLQEQYGFIDEDDFPVDLPDEFQDL